MRLQVDQTRGPVQGQEQLLPAQRWNVNAKPADGVIAKDNALRSGRVRGAWTGETPDAVALGLSLRGWQVLVPWV